MADNQSKIDAAAQKAFAEAAENKTIADGAKPAVVAAPVVKAEDATRQDAVKPAAAKKVVAKKRVAKVVAKQNLVAAKAPAKKQKAPAAVKISKPTNITQLKDKIMATANTTTADFTAKAKETVADMQTRMKTAYDKGGEMTADMTAFHKGNFDAVVEAGKVLASTMQDLGRNAVEDAKLAAETVTADVKAMAAVKSPTELFQLQGEIARRNLDTIVARTSKNAEVMMKLANDMFAPLSTRASVAMERLNKAA